MSNFSNTAGSIAGDLGIGDTHAAKATRAGVSKEVHDFIADVEDLVKDATTMSGDELAKAKSTLSDRIASAKESLAGFGNAAAAKARVVARDTDTFVHEQPWKAIGISAVIGLLLGVVLARR